MREKTEANWYIPYHKQQVYTLTMDNGNEFGQHQKVKKALRADVYFVHPYCAWQRGLNENTNGLSWQYFPKGINFKTVSRAKIQQIEQRLNNRVRKGLEFQTPNEIFHSPKTNYNMCTSELNRPFL